MLGSVRRIDPASQPRDVIPLSVAATLALERIEGAFTAPRATEREDQLNRVAVAISVLVPIFRRDPHSGAFDRLSEVELASGHFLDGARRFVRGDDECEIQDLAIQRPDLNAAIDQLLRSMK
jgi:hypothetical protein